ncbi:hypothetical protein D6D28_07685 [Aureobasidium pullulans]|uniref:C2H2-type domain-containing protein n=1 Tax=Aureobasidium pullulans TaxID=5580 RepID=A0A4S8SAF2_AURPU|nr:hypothetical protein D6D28_07685 [Aureobasidium pullulans]
MTAKDSRMSAVMANSIYTTFRMAQLINSFRNRVKTRLLSHTATTKASDASTQDDLHDEWEDEVLDIMSDGRIQRQLVKRRGSCVKNLENNSHSYTTANDSRLGQGGSRVTDLHVAYGLLAKLDCKLFPGTSLADLAVDSTFMSQWYNIDFNGGVKKVAELLALTNGLLSVLKLSGAQDTTNQSTHFGDAIFAANLEHLLLCVQNDLLRFLLNEAWPKILDHIFECQREQSRRCEAWFFEYPDARHPLSTTWPWSIRPSLAVLWGVCWKFLDNYDYQWDDQGNLLMPSGEVLLWAHDLLGYDGPEASYGSGNARSTQPRDTYVDGHRTANTVFYGSSVTANPLTDLVVSPCLATAEAHHANSLHSKHMDKHERPYKCDKPQCAKLLGFTYSGGLLRHEREVHGMHGGPKEQLFCPIKHCKRHTEQGFTRRENLQEHLRRVHKLQDVDSVEAAAQDAPTPGTAPSDHDSEDEGRASKRKRMSVVSQNEELPEEDVRAELKKLRLDNFELKRMWEAQREEIGEMKQQLKQLTTQQHIQLQRWRPDGTG